VADGAYQSPQMLKTFGFGRKHRKSSRKTRRVSRRKSHRKSRRVSRRRFGSRKSKRVGCGCGM
jgi:hypothetical protein